MQLGFPSMSLRRERSMTQAQKDSCTFCAFCAIIRAGGDYMALASMNILSRSRLFGAEFAPRGRVEDAEVVDELVQSVEKQAARSQYATTGEVAQRLGVSRQTVVNWIKRGFLPGVKLGGQLWDTHNGGLAQRGRDARACWISWMPKGRQRLLRRSIASHETSVINGLGSAKTHKGRARYQRADRRGSTALAPSGRPGRVPTGDRPIHH